MLESEARLRGSVFNTLQTIVEDKNSYKLFSDIDRESISNLTMTTEEMKGDDCITQTDQLNAKLALAGMILLKNSAMNETMDEQSTSLFQNSYRCFASLPLHNALEYLAIKPPCRWEKIMRPIQIDESNPVFVEVILDLGHNPAAIAALMRKVSLEYSGRRVRYV